MDDSLDIFHAKERNILDVYLRWWMFNVSVRPIVKYFSNDSGGLYFSYLESRNLLWLSSVARMLCKEGNTPNLSSSSSSSLLCLSVGSFDHLWPGERTGPTVTSTTTTTTAAAWARWAKPVFGGSVEGQQKSGTFSLLFFHLVKYRDIWKTLSLGIHNSQGKIPFSDWINDLKWADTGSISGLFD